MQVMQVIRTELLLRGRGISKSPIRRIVQFWSMEGELLAEVDPAPGSDDEVAKAA